MNTNLVFCDNCREDVSYTIKDSEQQIGKLSGKYYHFMGKVAICNKCGSQVYVDEVTDFNLKALYDVFQKEHVLVSNEDMFKKCEV